MLRHYCFPDFFLPLRSLPQKNHSDFRQWKLLPPSAGENAPGILRAPRRGCAARRCRGACHSRVTPEDWWIS